MGNTQNSVCQKCGRTSTKEPGIQRACKSCHATDKWRKHDKNGNPIATTPPEVKEDISESQQALNNIINCFDTCAEKLKLEEVLLKSKKELLKEKKEESELIVEENYQLLQTPDDTIELCNLLLLHTKRETDKWCYLRRERNPMLGNVMHAVTKGHLKTKSQKMFGNTTTFSNIWQHLRLKLLEVRVFCLCFCLCSFFVSYLCLFVCFLCFLCI